jgi:hypothetical protein
VIETLLVLCRLGDIGKRPFACAWTTKACDACEEFFSRNEKRITNRYPLSWSSGTPLEEVDKENGEIRKTKS